MKWRHLKYVLPNLFTVSSIFCGLYAITLSHAGSTPSDFYTAALAVFFAMFFDGFDGRVARLTRTQSEFGVQLDSLADIVSFGAAPAMLVYWWALSGLGLVGFLLCCLFATCGALRLARFNVLSMRSASGGASKFFTGLPIPLAAGMLISVVIALHRSGPPSHQVVLGVAALVTLLALLMVSNVPYRTFKHLRLSPGTLVAFLLIVAAGVGVALLARPSLVLVASFSAYLAFGLVEQLLSMVRRKPARTGSETAASDDNEEFI